MTFNAQQQKAIAASGVVAIIAGPGTGKTKTLVARIQQLVATGVAPEQIVALTFTKKAAEELRARLGNVPVWAGTFHALCHEILGTDTPFITEPQRLAVVKTLPRPKGMTVRELALAISKAKNTNSQKLAATVQAYDHRLAELGVIDFDDLLLRTKKLLMHNNARHQALRARFKHVLVDEFQDTNPLQYDLLRLLVTDNLFVIGDPKQAIYGFRGAGTDMFDTLRADYPQCRQINLTVNYRSAKNIVAAANALFKGNLQAHREAVGEAKAARVLNEFSEATYVINQLQQAIGGSDLQRVISTDTRDTHQSLRDFAILYRNRSVARVMQQQLEQSGLPYQVVGEGSPYDDAHVQTIITCLAVLAGREVTTGDMSMHQVKAIVAPIAATTPIDIAEQLINTFDFSPTPALKQFLATLTRFKTMHEASDYFETLAQQQFYDPQAEAITLLTIHASKGLEFPAVFLIGAEEGVLPSEKGDISEEKRLFYVALTRAKDQFVATHALVRRGKVATLSRFIKAAALAETEDPQLAYDRRLSQKRRAKKAQTRLF